MNDSIDPRRIDSSISAGAATRPPPSQHAISRVEDRLASLHELTMTQRDMITELAERLAPGSSIPPPTAEAESAHLTPHIDGPIPAMCDRLDECIERIRNSIGITRRLGDQLFSS